jgi:hypothetical protein
MAEQKLTQHLETHEVHGEEFDPLVMMEELIDVEENAIRKSEAWLKLNPENNEPSNPVVSDLVLMKRALGILLHRDLDNDDRVNEFIIDPALANLGL